MKDEVFNLYLISMTAVNCSFQRSIGDIKTVKSIVAHKKNMTYTITHAFTTAVKIFYEPFTVSAE